MTWSDCFPLQLQRKGEIDVERPHSMPGEFGIITADVEDSPGGC